MTEAEKPISVTITKFPQNLIIPNVENIISIQLNSKLAEEAEFKFAFKGENLKVDLKTEKFKNKISFQPNETKNVNLHLSPLRDGIGKLIINVYWLKLIEYTTKVQKLRNSVSGSKISKILGDKTVLPSIKDRFDHDSFFNNAQKTDIKKLEKEIRAVQGDLEKKNEIIKELSISYISVNEFYKGLETALEISDQDERLNFYFNLIRAYAVVNFDDALMVVKNLNDKPKKRQLIRDLAIDFALVDLNHINSLLRLLEEDSYKLKVVLDVISKIAQKNVSMAMELFDHISDNLLKTRILFNFIKILYEKKQKEQIPDIVKKIHDLILSSSEKMPSNGQSNQNGYNFLKESICVLAELECPEVADVSIKEIPRKEIRDKLAQDLFDELYIMVDEIRSKIEPTLILSQYYSLNTYSSKVSEEIRNFSLLGGNISDNLLNREYDFNIVLISLFSLNFSIYPFIDRIYSKLKQNDKTKFAYYIYPSINNHDEDEKKIMQGTLKQFFPLKDIRSNLTIFNLDFIPYLGNPTVIFSSKSRNFIEKIRKKLNNKIEVLVDDEVFEGGESTDFLKQIFNSKNIQVENLVMSYEFINDLSLLEEIIHNLTS